MFRLISFIFFLLSILIAEAQTEYSLQGNVFLPNGQPANAALVSLSQTLKTETDAAGYFTINNIKDNNVTLTVFLQGYKKHVEKIKLPVNAPMMIQLDSIGNTLSEVVVESEKENAFGISKLMNVEGTAIYAGKKSEVVLLSDINANLATNNSRQVFAKVAGINIFENDGAGIQLGIGGRGLNPNRVSNFNTRQNGYDISADALGYPESYYTPPTEALDRIEVIRGAASLQYGTQFGGFINFKFKKPPFDKKIQLTSRQTYGSFGLFNSFNSMGGTIKTISYYTFYQYKQGKG